MLHDACNLHARGTVGQRFGLKTFDPFIKRGHWDRLRGRVSPRDGLLLFEFGA